jgi:hypothetical protein
MPNVPLAYVSVYRRMSDIFHTLAYASTIRNSVTGPLPICKIPIATVITETYLLDSYHSICLYGFKED